MPYSNIISVSPDGLLKWRGKTFRCALGRTGITVTKREGDGASPMGCFSLRRVLYRADRLGRPSSRLPTATIARHDGWCDAPGDPNYNLPVELPYVASAESLWRDDSLYDVLVVLGFNDSPVVPGCGSAIFLHVARDDYGPTAGCVALAKRDLLTVLEHCDSGTRLCILG
jgi:L,D-peptidoglycan transpeptidase YkuD (ErfK/YbiS/YcfS/YnhG family)